MIKKFESSTGEIVIEIDYSKCNGAAKCVEVCPVGIYELKNGKAVANNVDDCIECCACVESCPNNAIKHSSC
jgi:NAD-dependent dihydropyrimidine dehydrogenase PreA subunit